MKSSKPEVASKGRSDLPFKRVLLKISGEALQIDDDNAFLCAKVIERIVSEIIPAMKAGLQLGIVVGGGNIFRGAALSQTGIGRISADHMGMLGTVINALALRDVFEKHGQDARIMSSIPMSGIVDHYDRRKAMHHINLGRVVIFAAGTGNPLVTTDSAASLRAIEIGADLLVKASSVDGVYSGDPKVSRDCERFDVISYQQVVNQELKVMDLAAFCQCRDHNLPLRIYDINHVGATTAVLLGDPIGTLVKNI